MNAPRTTPAARPRRHWLRWLLLLLALLVLVPLLALLWLLNSSSGRDLALSRAAPLAGLAWERAEGTLSGPLRLHGVRMALGEAELRVRELELDLAPAALAGRNVHVESLRAAGVSLLLPPEQPTESSSRAMPELALPDLDLPVALRLDQVQVDGFALLRQGAPEPLLALDALALSGSVSRDGVVVLDSLRVSGPQGRLAGNGRIVLDGGRSMDLQLELRGPAADAPSARLLLAGKGAALTAALDLPGDDQLRLQLDGQRWSLDSALTDFDPAPWWPAWEQGALTLLLQADGEGSRARLASGRFAMGDTAVALSPSVLALDADAAMLTLDPLVLSPLAADGSPAGTATLRGRVATGDGEHALSIGLDALVLPGAGGGTLDGSGSWSGTPDAWELGFEGRLTHPDAELPLQLSGHGDRQALVLERFTVGGGRGESLTGSGRVQWTPALAISLDAQLQGFDPSRFHGDWPGALSGHVLVEASEQDTGWQATVELDRLRGQLRGRALRGEGELNWGSDTARTELSLAIGESRIDVSGTAGPALDLAIALAPLHLADLLPDARGRLQGQVRVTGSTGAPQLALALDASELELAGQQAGRLRIAGELAPDFSRPADLRVSGSALRLGGLAFKTAELQLSGARAAHQLQAELGGDTRLALALDGALDGNDDWQGTLQTLELTLPEQPTWRLRAPAALGLAGGGFSLAPACLAGPVMTLCAEARGDARAQQGELKLEALPLSALAPLLSAGEPVPLVLDGQVSGEATFERQGELLTFRAALALPEGSAALAATETRELLAWRGLTLTAATEGGTLAVRAEGTLEETGRLALELSGGQPWRSEDAAVSGSIEVELPRLRVLELLTPHVADPDGRLEAALSVAGSWSAPRLDGEVVVAGLRSELPALGITLRDSRLRATPRADGTLALSGRIDSGEGVLELDGQLGRGEQGLTATVQLSGQRVLASDTPLVRALVSPALTLRYDASGLNIDGRVAIPEARLDLDRLEGSVSPSPDVVVLDPREPADGDGAMPITAQVALELGDAVSLEGMGFDGRVSGQLTVSERPGRVTTARGTLDVRGEYTAYGQDLEVVHGRLLYSATPLDNPSLDVRAIRSIREQTVGLNIRGSARQPELEIFAEPPLEQAEALSYLVLGRPLESASSADGGQLSQAAAAIGGNFLAERLGARLGFDTFEVGDSEGLDATAFTVGKYLSPKLYVSYGMALFEDGRLLTLRYILSRRFELEFESGSENRVGVNYTLER